MTKIWKILNLIILGLLILICILGIFYNITFGHGMGDIFDYFILCAGTIIHLILTLVARKKGKSWHMTLTMLFLIFIILISLNATIWRGNEYPWNGSIFYLPCPEKIEIKNDNIDKKLC